MKFVVLLSLFAFGFCATLEKRISVDIRDDRDRQWVDSQNEVSTKPSVRGWPFWRLPYNEEPNAQWTDDAKIGEQFSSYWNQYKQWRQANENVEFMSRWTDQYGNINDLTPAQRVQLLLDYVKFRRELIGNNEVSEEDFLRHMLAQYLPGLDQEAKLTKEQILAQLLKYFQQNPLKYQQIMQAVGVYYQIVYHVMEQVQRYGQTPWSREQIESHVRKYYQYFGEELSEERLQQWVDFLYRLQYELSLDSYETPAQRSFEQRPWTYEAVRQVQPKGYEKARQTYPWQYERFEQFPQWNQLKRWNYEQPEQIQANPWLRFFYSLNQLQWNRPQYQQAQQWENSVSNPRYDLLQQSGLYAHPWNPTFTSQLWWRSQNQEQVPQTWWYHGQKQVPQGLWNQQQEQVPQGQWGQWWNQQKEQVPQGQWRQLWNQQQEQVPESLWRQLWNQPQGQWRQLWNQQQEQVPQGQWRQLWNQQQGQEPQGQWRQWWNQQQEQEPQGQWRQWWNQQQEQDLGNWRNQYQEQLPQYSLRQSQEQPRSYWKLW